MSSNHRRSRKQFRTPITSPVSTIALSQMIGLSQSVILAGLEELRDRSDVLSLSQDATQVLDISRSLADDLLLSQDVQVVGGSPEINVSDTLSLTDAVISNFLPISVSDTLSLSDTAHASQFYIESLTDSLVLTQLLKSDPTEISVTDTISLIDFVNSGQIEIIVADTLRLSDRLGNVFRLTVASTLGLTDSFRDRERFFDVLGLTQTIHVTQTLRFNFVDVIPFQQTIVRSGVIRIDLGDGMALDERLREQWDLTYRPVDTLSLHDVASPSYLRTVTDPITLRDFVGIPGTAATLTISQSVVVAVAKALSNTLSLTQSISVELAGVRSISQPLGLTQSALSFVFRDPGTAPPPNTPDMPPGTGSTPQPGDPSYTPVTNAYRPSGSGLSQSVPSTTPSTSVTLTYPYISPSQSLQLRSPLFGDQDAIEQQRIYTKSRGGTQAVHRTSGWPKNRKLSYTIEALTKSQRDSLITFYMSSLGQEIGLLDFESRQWRGFLTVDEIKHKLRRCGYAVTLTFDGVLT